MKFIELSSKIRKGIESILVIAMLGICAALIIHGCAASSEIQIYPSQQGFTTGNNMPVLSWRSIDCDKYEIWIDGIKMDEVSSRVNSYTPFPLSFGKHNWKVIALQDHETVISEEGEFTITDEALVQLSDNSLLLRNNWKVKSSLTVNADGQTLSGQNYDTHEWFSTSLPATALTVLVRNGVYPNPYKAMNNMLIPDISDTFNTKNDLLKYSHIPGKNPWSKPYWYVTEFSVPESFDGKMVRLCFNEINYRAEVWFNGVQLSDTSSMVGMERSFRFDVTSSVNREGSNHLAVAIYPPDNPGEPSPPPVTPLAHPGRNLGLDAMLTKDYTKWDAMGWDWQPAVRDRDMGITEDVFLEAVNDLEIEDIYVTSDLPLPDTTRADLRIEFDIVNHSSNAKSGKINLVINSDGSKINFDHPFSIGADQKVKIVLDKENTSSLVVNNPQLWWPVGYGKPNLYELNLSLQSDEGAVEEKSVNFGIREVETYIGSNERIYKINGKEVYPKGGNWVIDMLLNWTASRYKNEIHLTKNANMNMLRIWGPTGAPPEVFYDEADKQGIMLWQDFLNDFWGAFRNTPGYYPDIDIFEANTISIVKKYRNHPSLVIWCGGNEGPNPREELIMNKILPEYDGHDSRHYLKISNGDGLHGGGPYHTLQPEEYFSEPKLSGFSSELGPSGVPVFRSIEQFITNPGQQWKPGRFPIDAEWTYHDATDRSGGDPRRFSYYDDVVKESYGIPDTSDSIKGVESYLEKCQLLNYDVYRAVGESINRGLWDKSSGWLLWKSNSSWPSLTWQIYDWYMQAHAGYYGCKKSAEPFHIQLNRDDMSVVILNTFQKKFQDVNLKAVLYDSNLNEIWSASTTTEINANGVSSSGYTVPKKDKLCFLKLTADSRDEKAKSENFYWLKSNNDLTELNELSFSQVSGTVEVTKVNINLRYELTLKNNGSGLAFMIGLSIMNGKGGPEILPTIWSDNYLNLLPGEMKTVYAEISDEFDPDLIVIECKGYNTDSVFLEVEQPM